MKFRTSRIICACVLGLMMSLTVASASSVEVTVSETTIVATENTETVSFDIYLTCDCQFVTADFYLRTTGDGLTFKSFALNDVSGSKSSVDLTDKFDYQVMGFFTSGDGYAPGTTYNIGTVTYTYTGNDPGTISLLKGVITSWDDIEERNTLYSWSPTELFEIEIYRESKYDLNGDGIVNYADISCIIEYYGYPIDDDNSKYNVTDDSSITSEDFLAVYQNMTE